MKKPLKQGSRHQLTHVEKSATISVELRTLGKGDVFIRQGTPHMLVDPGTNIPAPSAESMKDFIWVCNLTTGSTWPISPTEQVWPALEAQLTLTTTRRD